MKSLTNIDNRIETRYVIDYVTSVSGKHSVLQYQTHSYAETLQISLPNGRSGTYISSESRNFSSDCY